jgi:hypothetical protein
MSLHRPAPAPLTGLDPGGHTPGRRLWPFVAGGVVAGLLVVALVAAFVVRRDGGAAADAPAEQVVLAEGVTAGGGVSGQARTLADALVRSGLECSVRFTGADGGQTGCFTFREAGRITSEVVYQYRPDGTVIGLNIKMKTPGTTNNGPMLRSLVATVAPVVFAADLPALTRILREWGGWTDGSWGSYEIVSRGPRASLSASKADSTPIKVPVLHFDTPETGLADGLRSDGFACARDTESCRGRYAGKAGLTVQMSGPDTGITYLLASAATGPTTQPAFDELQGKVFGHLRGDAVQPSRQWLAGHLDGRSHIAYVAGWRVDLQVFHGTTAAAKKQPGQIRLTVFNEEVWQVPT